jgi:hypothetical protein
MNTKNACASAASASIAILACALPLVACAASGPSTSGDANRDDAGPGKPPGDDAGNDAPGITSCAAGFADCNGHASDGCETDLSQAAHCGSCATVCSGSTPLCAKSGSAYACTSGCTAGAPTECGSSCVDTTSDANHCGACGTACPAPAHGKATCASSTCGVSCDAAYHACGATCADNGSVQTCGASCTPCTAPSNATPTCDGTSCGYGCNTGYHACGATCSDDASVNSCGSSCTPCATPPNAQPTCMSGACGFMCNAGFADCDGNAANGCEVNLENDGKNCGACGHLCMGGACSSAACQPMLVASMASPDQIFGDANNLYVRSSTTAILQLTKAGAQFDGSNFGSTVEILGLDATRIYWMNWPNPASFGSIAKGTSQWDTIYNGYTAVRGCVSGSVFAWDDGTNIRTGPLQGGTVAIKHTTPGFMEALACDLGGIIGQEDIASTKYLYEYNQTFTKVTQLSIPKGYSPFYLVLDPTNVYWPDYLTNTVWKSPRSGAAAVQLATGANFPAAMATDATDIYWSDQTVGAIMRVPIAGGAVTQVTVGNAIAIYVDGTAIYWADSNGGRVMRVAK